jgi:MFS family permease
VSFRDAVQLLKVTDFRRQFVARTASNLGTGITPVALSLGVLQLTGQVSDLGLVLGAHTVAMVAFLLFGGVWADRLPRSRVMMTADLARMVIQCCAGVALVSGNLAIWFLCLLQAGNGIATAFAQPAAAGLTRQTAGPERLQQANAMLALSRNVAGTGGPLVAGVLVVTAGAGWALIIDGVTFAVSAFFLSRLTLPAPVRREKGRLLTELRTGWREVHTRTWIWSSLISFAVLNIAFALILVLGPAETAARHGEVAWGIVVMAISVGQLLGNAAVLKVRVQRPLVSGRLVEFLMVPLLLALAVGAPLWVVIVAATAAGVAMSYPDALWMTALQHHIPDERIAKVAAYDWLVSLALRPVGFAIAALSAGWGASRLLWCAAAAGILVLVLSLVPRDVRQLRYPSTKDVPAEVPNPATSGTAT